MSDPAVRVEVRPDRVAVLTIDQPGAKVNVLTVALWAELEAALDALPRDLAGLVIASGKPGCFIAGADLKLLADATPGDPAVKAFIEQGLRVLEKLEALPFPTCAAIDGVALGGGLEVALACDWRAVSASPKVQLALPEVKLGLIPGWGGTQRLPRRATKDAAQRMLLTGESIDAAGAVAAALAMGPFGSEDVVEQAARMTELGKYLPRAGSARRWQGIDVPDSHAARVLHQTVTDGINLPLEEGIQLETKAFLRLAGSDESRAKIAAFFAARKR